MLDYLFPILSFIDLFSDWKPTISFILTSLIVIIVLPLYLKWPRKKGKTEKHFSFLYHWIDLLILILIPLFLYIKLTEEYDNYDEGGSIILGFVLSLIFIFYIELTSRFKKVRLFYFFILACSCATLISFISYFSFIISFIKNSEPILSFMLTSLIVIIVLPLYFKSPLKKGETEKHFSFLYHWFDLLILILIPLLLYIKLLAEKYNKDDEGGSIILGFILSLIFIFYIELTSRFEKVRLFYFFILACSCATLISFLYIPLKLIIFYRIDYAF
ncbi:hypothetical protein [Leptospira interrogans]|uniref:hypothetical protein n=1 Tax=Leptospira interrogans TaxID=173 RepID=UPI000297AEF8|nr:hypothetical protein [Leptospira interrogans]EKR83894.1 putative membrane protein [Leptospira interrogans str. UI 08452]EMN36272.1 putative membrane protein [Leptospira interrogans serovar Medanensis str. L0448]EMN40980.1 putative membrane protein [Leptospira interrogans str. L0996]EMN66605.1 putative membrane protein [Leptospira interrogans serovar Grippotyphosa str. UI 08434]EMN96695.1 putative membrane protein [Leptospira interrogans serovar Medanensis str. UT053]